VGGSFDSDQVQALVRFAAIAPESGFYVAEMFFGPGSFLFFYLFYKSGYIPRAVATLGAIGSVINMLVNFGALIFPAYAGTMQFAWAPMGIAELVTGLWLVIAGIRPAPVREVAPA
jgi:hypothetical protein